MLDRILVPLDQSRLGEAVLPVVADLARGGKAAVRLLHVAPQPGYLTSPEGRVVAYADQEMARLEAEGLDYLQTVQLEGIPAECVVRFGDPVEEILAEAESWGADLLVVTTAGRSGVGRAMLGSVAEHVFRRTAAPVMLFRAGRARP